MPIAGAQSLMPMMNFRLTAPGLLVDLNGLSELDGARHADGWLEIGAMTRYRTLAASAVIAEMAPLMAKALPHIAHPAIRNRGTLGGSVALADPAAEMPAVLIALGARIVLAGTGGMADRMAIRQHISGNCRRCTGYQAIVDAIADVIGGRARA